MALVCLGLMALTTVGQIRGRKEHGSWFGRKNLTTKPDLTLHHGARYLVERQTGITICLILIHAMP